MKNISEYLLESFDFVKDIKKCKTFGEFLSLYLAGDNEEKTNISDLTKDDYTSLDLGYTLFRDENMSYDDFMKKVNDMADAKISKLKVKDDTIQFTANNMDFDLDYC